MRISILLLLTISAFAQNPFDSYYAPARQFLQLNPEQLARIQRNFDEFYEWHSAKQQRAAQVYEEINVESARDEIVPGALGIRWAELEGIRRHVADRRKALILANQSVLTDAQKAKLKSLEDVVKLETLINSARLVGVLPPPVDSCGSPDSIMSLVSGGLIGVVCGSSPGGRAPDVMPESLRRMQQFLRR